MSSSIRCDWSYNEIINYAMQQNHVPVVRSIVLSNTTEDDIGGLVVKLQAEPEFAYEWSKTIDSLPAGENVDLGAVHIQLLASFLGGLSERVNGTLTLTVSQGESVLAQHRVPIGILAFDEWSGLTILPEMAAAFITPNNPFVLQIVREAAELLGKWSGSSAFSAYQSKDPNRVRMQAAAIYHAIQSKGIVYCVAPPSFETIGQRVRLPDAIMTHRMGNCLDLSLLYAACMEAVGLHPLLVFTEGHAFAGVWLIEETFSESVQDDCTLLTKRIAAGINEICLMESTLMAEGQTSDFDRAVSFGASHLHNPDKFICIVDVRRARAGAIRPLPLRSEATGGWLEEETVTSGKAGASPAPELVDIIAKPVEVDAIPMTRQKHWERRLLDLTLRNSLLNFRLTKSSVGIMTLQLNELEDSLSERVDFQLLARPHDWQDSLRSASLYQTLRNNSPMEELLREEFNRKRLRVDLSEEQLERRLVHLHRAARLSIEENGANTLYLALGVLKWYETNASELPRYAPLVLIPVNLVKTVLRGGFVIRGRDEEPQLNITLLEMLRQDFGIAIGGLDPLPRDEKGIDLKGVFAALRHALMPFSRWDVEESAFLGLFSFGQFVMWNDIRSRSDELADNAIVASLMEGRLKWEQQDNGPSRPLDEAHPTELLIPVSTDSSQLLAIRTAAKGESFVLHGPPGTGKSQTITNMIASALAEGKRVLFVAEKMAALSVVQRRLEAIGLGPFFLELHSNKSTKRAVLEQLQSAIETPRLTSSEDWSRQAERLAKLRGELNDYIAALHYKHRFGFSLFEAISGYERIGKGSEHVVFNGKAIGELTEDRLIRWRDLAGQLEAAGALSRYRLDHPWRDARCTVYSQSMRTELEERLESYAGELARSKAVYAEAMQLLGFPHAVLSRGKLDQLAGLLRLMLRTPDVRAALLAADDIGEAADMLRRAARQGARRDAIKQKVCETLKPDSLLFDAKLALSEWSKSELAWLLPRLLGQRRIVKLVRMMAIPGAMVEKDNVKTVLASLIEWQEEERKLDLEQASASLVGASLWNGEHGDWEGMAVAADWAAELQAKLVEWFNDPIAAKEALGRLAGMLAGGRSGIELHYGAWHKAIACHELMEQQEASLSVTLKLDRERLELEAGMEGWHSYMGSKTERWRASLGELRDWCSWRRVRDEAEEAGLSPLLDCYESGLLPTEELGSAFERGLYKCCANYIFEQDERLGAFSGTLFEDKIARYRETDKRFEELTQRELIARLSARVPQMSQEAAQSSEAGILQRAIRSGGRSMSIRKLLDSIPNLLPRLTPCMLMSPLSVAQYLDPKNPKFDLVIFDEASQVPTAEAVGALARGHQTVIVGDPKQLPPTSFFSKSSDEENEDDAIIQDMESILDDCLALGMKQMHLSWHYRSRHESLIAFSNAHYYENKLMTFPSPDEPVSSVSWRHVEGFYDRGRSKHNRAEAEAVVAEIVKRLKSEQLRKFSIGVVTFSSVQQTLIEDMMDKTLRDDSELEKLMLELPESIFIKNLENVQGDERDVILFSIGYGPDANGKVSLNFGPLNRDGGWRRLNVAVSRARHEMIVFSTLQAHQLSASQTSAAGVHGLKAFLEYAEKGRQGLPSASLSKQAAAISDVHRSLADELNKRGYKTDIYVGSSGYRIDVGIVDADNEGQYRLGIMLDGPIYASAQSARDRDILRIQVLEGLGWSLHRLWLPDWWENREGELAKIEQAIEQAKQREGAGDDRLPSAAHRQVLLSAEDEASDGREGMTSLGRDDSQSTPSETADAPVQQIAVSGKVEEGVMRYSAAKLAPAALSSDAFYAASAALITLQQMKQVLEAEGPISRSLLMKRVLHAWGIGRIGAKLERRFEELMAGVERHETTTDGTLFLWPKSIDPSSYGIYRTADAEDERRAAEDLPAEEVANAVRAVLKAQISLPIDDLARGVIRLLGYARSGAALDKAARSGIACALQRGYASMNEDGRVILEDN